VSTLLKETYIFTTAHIFCTQDNNIRCGFTQCELLTGKWVRWKLLLLISVRQLSTVIFFRGVKTQEIVATSIIFIIRLRPLHYCLSQHYFRYSSQLSNHQKSMLAIPLIITELKKVYIIMCKFNWKDFHKL